MGHIRSAGLGHKLTEAMLGMTFALDTQSIFVYDKDIFATENKHDVYDWLPNFLPLHQFEVTFRDVDNFQKLQKQQRLRQQIKSPTRSSSLSSSPTRIKTISGQYDTLIRKSREAEEEEAQDCHNNNNNNNTVVFYKTMLNKCCRPDNKNKELNSNNCYCSKDVYRVGAADRVKWRFRHAFSKSKYKPSITSLLQQQNITTTATNNVDITIVWHLRVGDIVLNNETDFFWNIAKQFMKSFQKTINRVHKQQRREQKQKQSYNKNNTYHHLYTTRILYW